MRCALLVLGLAEKQNLCLSEQLAGAEFKIEVIAYKNANNLTNILKMVNVDCVLLYHQAGQFDAFEPLKIIQNLAPDCGTVICVDDCQPNFIRQAFLKGVDDCIIQHEGVELPKRIIQIVKQKKRKKLSRTINAELELLRAVMDNTPALVMVCDAETSLFISFNQALNRFLDLSNEQIKSRSYFHISEQFESTSDWFRFVEQVKSSGHLAYEAYLKNHSGESIPFEFDCSMTQINESNYLLFNGMDISRLKVVQNELVELANRDPLTKLRNRRGLADEFERLIKASIRSKNCLCLALFDLDNFKKINDQYGHDVGDQVLQDFASVLCSIVQRPLDLVVRAGGEEFIVIMLNGSEASLLNLLNKVIEKTPLSTQPITTVSGGAIFLSSIDISYEQAFKLADNNLYQAKKQGKNQLVTQYIQN
ncbi:sensor domain-containing diguanylate cyclase [Catenovulum adriaticum]|uniref:diguanylate cyclase n=1 Tax=Catenovulum adriaticum TaxID=2984846 RepID=A0ABY7AJT2_9ALTE|nr:diguanylate cyclase [Catenovulum sp. TS8]WAJ69830.1 diguanylate cyclase [Catenovulum sp. TS8]